MQNQKVTSFTTEAGNEVTVFNTKRMAKKGFWAGCAETTRTYAVVNGKHEVEVEKGCVFKASSAVARAGY